MGKRGQVTIFIIVGVLVVAIIIFYFLLRSNILPNSSVTNPEQNPVGFLGNCIGPHVKEAVGILLKQGGSINPGLYHTIDGQNVSYLCFNQNYYYACINQEPKLIEHLRQEIHNYIAGDVEDCVQSLKKSLEEKSYTVDLKYNDFDVSLIPKKVVVNINMEMSVSKNGESTKRNDFKFIVPSALYDIAIVAQEITSQEARFCNFEQLGFMIFYPEFNIEKFRTTNLDTLYTIKYRKTEEQFRFLVRGCVIPPGF